MDFSLNDDQLAIRELAYQIFTDRATDGFMLDFSRTGKTYDDALWSTLAEQGLLGIATPEAFGGSGLGLIELCLVLEEMGRRVAPVPVFSSLVLGGLPLARFGSEELQRRWLPGLVAGDVKLSAAIAEVGMSPLLAGTVTATQEGEGWVLNGHRDVVPDGAVANCILVPAVGEDGSSMVFAVDTSASGVTLTAETVGLLGERAAGINLNGVVVAGSDRLGAEGEGDAVLEWIEQHGNIGHCAMQTGVTEEATKRTADYLGEREQFGVPLGTFQALAMRMADSYIDVEAIRSTYWLALWRLSEGLDARAEVRAAKWWACEASARVVQTAQHLHGGIGADMEYPIHRFFLNAKLISYSLGTGSVQLDRLGELLANDDSLGFRALEV